MNRENITKLRDTFIRLHAAPLPEYPDKGFNMRFKDFPSFQNKINRDAMQNYTQHNCGTAACIEGWVNLVFGRFFSIENGLGLSTDDMDDLTMPEITQGSYDESPKIFTLEAAITTLTHLLDTGEVDWAYGIANPDVGEAA